MGVCVLGMGDCGSTSTIVNNMTSSTVNQILTNMVNTTSQNVAATQINIQTANVTLGNIKNCKDIGNIYQEMGATQTVTVNLDLKSTQSLQNQVATALKAKVSTDIEQKQGFLTTASTTANTTTNINDYINNLTSTNITSQTLQDIKAFMNSAQTGSFLAKDIDCSGLPPGTSANIGNISQHMVTSQVVDIVMKAVMGQTVNNIIDNTVDQTADIKVKQENSGFGGMLSDIIGKITGLVGGAILGTFIMMMCPCIVLICCAFICCGKKKSSGFGFGEKRKITKV